MEQRSESGFTLIKGLAIGAVALLVVGAWLITRAASSSDQENPTAQTTANTNSSLDGDSSANDLADSKKTNWDQYSNDEFGFMFSYPRDWTTETSERDKNPPIEGIFSIYSPSGTQISFSYTTTGKGGNCAPDPADTPHNTLNCSTMEYLRREALPTRADYGRTVYLSQVRYTQAGKSSVYKLLLGTPDEKAPTINTEAAVGYGILNSSKLRPGYIVVNVYGGDQSSAAYFNSVQAKEASEVLRTFRLY